MKRNKWLSRKDSNLRLKLQRLQCYHYTTRQYQLLVCPNCQASDRFASVYVFSPRRHGSIPVVRKEITMKTLTIIGSTTNPIPQKGDEMSKQTLREGPMGKETTGERVPTLNSRSLSCLRLQYSTLFWFCQEVFQNFLKVFQKRGLLGKDNQQISLPLTSCKYSITQDSDFVKWF